MKRVLITGMSGTGKSSVLEVLASMGFETVDMDAPGWSHLDEQGHQRWNVERLQATLDASESRALFVAGCAEDQVAFYARFTEIILLSAPRAVIVERLKTRTNNPYGKSPEQRAAVLENLERIEPRLRARATHEMMTTKPLAQVVDEILTCTDLERPPKHGTES